MMHLHRLQQCAHRIPRRLVARLRVVLGLMIGLHHDAAHLIVGHCRRSHHVSVPASLPLLLTHSLLLLLLLLGELGLAERARPVVRKRLHQLRVELGVEATCAASKGSLVCHHEAHVVGRTAWGVEVVGGGLHTREHGGEVHSLLLLAVLMLVLVHLLLPLFQRLEFSHHRANRCLLMLHLVHEGPAAHVWIAGAAARGFAAMLAGDVTLALDVSRQDGKALAQSGVLAAERLVERRNLVQDLLCLSVGTLLARPPHGRYEVGQQRRVGRGDAHHVAVDQIAQIAQVAQVAHVGQVAHAVHVAHVLDPGWRRTPRRCRAAQTGRRGRAHAAAAVTEVLDEGTLLRQILPRGHAHGVAGEGSGLGELMKALEVVVR
mmetsp:Transcript_35711/g.89217  ORF Transcript_35711/g.89217 Transcript_35711/m.89217 type:complete len:375 (-) Transcript_35711:528-1652(-)